MPREEKDRIYLTPKELLQVLKDLDGEEFLITVPLIENARKKGGKENDEESV